MHEISTLLSTERLTDLVGKDKLRDRHYCENVWLVKKDHGLAWEIAAIWLLVQTVSSVPYLRPVALPPTFATQYLEYNKLLCDQLVSDFNLESIEEFTAFIDRHYNFSPEAVQFFERLKSWLRRQHSQFKYHWLLRIDRHPPGWFKPICG
jgi:hypothetical protein